MVLVDGTEEGKKATAGTEEGSGMPKACRCSKYWGEYSTFKRIGLDWIGLDIIV